MPRPQPETQSLSFLDIALWVVLPYVSFAILIVGLAWRYKTDQYGWTSRSSQWNEPTILRWASPLFHFGVLFVFMGHILGLVIPKTWTEAAGVPQHVYHLMATIPGTIAGIMTIVGLALLIYRRLVYKSVRVATTRMDIVTYVMLTIPVLLGGAATLLNQVLGGHEGYDYRETISVWFRSIFYLHPQAHLMVDVPLSFKLHIVAGLLLFCMWPFTRLVHAVSAPVGYVARPPVIYRSRDERRDAPADARRHVGLSRWPCPPRSLAERTRPRRARRVGVGAGESSPLAVYHGSSVSSVRCDCVQGRPSKCIRVSGIDRARIRLVLVKITTGL